MFFFSLGTLIICWNALENKVTFFPRGKGWKLKLLPSGGRGFSIRTWEPSLIIRNWNNPVFKDFLFQILD